MGVTPLAFDSFGARSIATFVEADNVPVLIDPGIAARCGQIPAAIYNLIVPDGFSRLSIMRR